MSGHVKLRKRKRGAIWYVKYRLANGSQCRPTRSDLDRSGSSARRPLHPALAEEALHEILTDAQRGDRTPVPSGVTFADATAEWLRHDAQERAWTTSPPTTTA